MTNKNRQVVFSGSQPTCNSLHLGNALGAIIYWKKLQNNYETYFCVVDQHAITVMQNPNILYNRTLNLAAQYLALGISPVCSKVFIQSHIAEHSQLAWLLNCFASFGQISRMTQFKDRTQKNGAEASNVGFFTYPILMAADILLYNTNKVPVGKDQQQHLELARNLANKFNFKFSDTFIIPEALIHKTSSKIYDLQNPLHKMSKSSISHAGSVLLSDESDLIYKKINSAVTDNYKEIQFNPRNQPGISNLLVIQSAITGIRIDTLVNHYSNYSYKNFKKDVAETVVEFISPIKIKVNYLLNNVDELKNILTVGAENAKSIAKDTLFKAYCKIGLL